MARCHHDAGLDRDHLVSRFHSRSVDHRSIEAPCVSLICISWRGFGDINISATGSLTSEADG